MSGARAPEGAARNIDDPGDRGALAQRPEVQPVRVPTDRYTSEAFAQREARALWPGVWQVACTIDHLAERGDYFAYELGTLSILVVRGDDGALRAFQNVCRHRGNELAHGSGSGLTEIRCGYHRWCWDLAGCLREIPSRRSFGVLDDDDYGLVPAAVDHWGPLVFVNPEPSAEPLTEFLEAVPADIGPLDDFRCTHAMTVPLPCNWKTLIDGFSETYHVQGIHRELLATMDDLASRQLLWQRHGRSVQPYGLASPRLRGRVDDQGVWEAFVATMGARIGRPETEPGPRPSVPAGGTLRDSIAGLVRAFQAERGVDLSGYSDDDVMCLRQYNLFPNTTVLVFPDLLQVVKARPGGTPDESLLDAFMFERRPAGDRSRRARPMDVSLGPDDADFGLVLNQDLTNLGRVQRGLRQPGLTHLTLSPTEECRILQLHRNLERVLGIRPSELEGDCP